MGMPAREFEQGPPLRTSAAIADKLRQAADILAAQHADPFRIAAYRKAADVLLASAGNVVATFERGGRKALDSIPGIGVSIASAIAEMLTRDAGASWSTLGVRRNPKSCSARCPGLDPRWPAGSAKPCTSAR